MNKNAIQKFAIWARNELIAQVSQRAYQYGIDESGFGDASADTLNGRLLTAEEKSQRQELIKQIKEKGYKQVMEEVAYTWFNRFIALRFMEVNNYLPSHIRVFSDASGAFKPEILNDVLHIDLPGLDSGKVADYIESNDTEALYRYLLLTQCNALNSALPVMFERMGGYTEMLLPNNILRQDSVLGQMVDAIPEEDWTDEVEIIGWLYQYYISEKHEEVVDPLHGKTVKKEDIPAATQLFTTDWVVRYILDNSLGRYWIERHPESRLAEKLSFLVTPKSGRFELVDENIKPEELKVLDPCVGSGHFLSYAFDVLMEIYRENGWSDRDAAKSIIENNLFGLDIDDRAAQLAYFAVMMKARKYNRRIISADTSPHIMAMQDSVGISDELIKYVSKNDKSIQNDLVTLRTVFANAKEYGSIISVPKIDYRSLYMRIGEIKDTFAENFMDMALQAEALDKLPALIAQAEILSEKYDIVATNPPYLNKYSPQLKNFVCEHYAAYKGDLFSVFMFRNFAFCKENGYSGFMTPNVWMFIKSYEELRLFIIGQKNITSLVQMAKGAFFKEATVDICAFILANKHNNENGLYIRLENFKGGMEVQKQKVLEALADKNCGYFYETNQSNFSKIPGSPVAYWVSDTAICNFSLMHAFGEYYEPRQGLATGDDASFLRYWYEVNNELFAIGYRDKETLWTMNKKYVPFNKGGSFRKWYGNNEYVIKFDSRNYEKLSMQGNRLPSKQYYFHEGVTWSALTSALFSARYCDVGFVFAEKGPMCFANDSSKTLKMCALMNSKPFSYFYRILSATMDFNQGTMRCIPYSDTNLNVEECAHQCIALSKDDWDSYEDSWDFKRNPLV